MSNSPPLSFSSSLSLSERKMSEQSKRFPMQDMTQAKEEEKEVQNFQELPHQQQREDDHEEEHTPTSPNASHAGHAEEHEEQEEKKEDNNEDIITVSLSPPPETPSKRPVQDSNEDSHDDTPRSFLEMVLTDINYEIGFLNGFIDFHDMNVRYPYYEYFALQDFIKNWLQIDTTHLKMLDVIVKLRKKYIKTKAKTDVSMHFVDPRYQRAFNLAHKIWSDAIEEDWKLLKLGVIAPVLCGPDQPFEGANAREDPGSSY